MSHPGPAKLARRSLHWPLAPRDPGQEHRSSTPLELLFDLCFVVAVGQAAARLHHSVGEGHTGHGLVGYATVFFAIWWAWMNFSWFASAYDQDDVLYRVLTLVQMSGVLVLATGVDAAFEDADFTRVTVGYVVMRVPMTLQWLRAAAGDPARRTVAIRYASGLIVTQLGWVARLALPHSLGGPRRGRSDRAAVGRTWRSDDAMAPRAHLRAVRRVHPDRAGRVGAGDHGGGQAPAR